MEKVAKHLRRHPSQNPAKPDATTPRYLSHLRPSLENHISHCRPSRERTTGPVDHVHLVMGTSVPIFVEQKSAFASLASEMMMISLLTHAMPMTVLQTVERLNHYAISALWPPSLVQPALRQRASASSRSVRAPSLPASSQTVLLIKMKYLLVDCAAPPRPVLAVQTLRAIAKLILLLTETESSVQRVVIRHVLTLRSTSAVILLRAVREGWRWAIRNGYSESMMCFSGSHFQRLHDFGGRGRAMNYDKMS